MLIKKARDWEIPEREATPESVYVNRRAILKAAGFLGAAGLMASLPAAANVQSARRNPEFELDRPITEEWAATSYNNYYEFSPDKMAVKSKVDKFVVQPWSIEVTGLVEKRQTLDLDALLKQMPLEERLYRFRCVEAWAMAVPWTGFPLAELIKRVKPRSDARYLRFETVHRPSQMPGIATQNWYAWPYVEALRMDEAMNPLTLLVTGMYGKPVPKQNGAPVRLITPWKYGFKSIKSIVRIEFTKGRPTTFWNSSQPREYGFYANVNPAKPHPRWSQATEKLIPSMEVRPTQLYNGYGKYVESMYKGNEF
jgi:methionine sulfoxide reductase catalytic subunit